MVSIEIGDRFILLFALTCTYLLAVGKKHIVKFIGGAVPTWAYCRLICMGEYSYRTDHLPPNMLTPDERALLIAERRRYRAKRHTLAEESEDDFAGDAGSGDEESEEECAGDAGSECDESDDEREPVDKFLHLLGEPPKEALGHEVLCNLTKRLYVRRHELDVPAEITPAHVLVSQVCWSDDPSCKLPTSMRYETSEDEEDDDDGNEDPKDNKKPKREEGEDEGLR
ncbi:hypothetical protein BN946_scf185023.g2 [Trametes cinnabarina]|uniref:Uncharacterized protein n=1 Tax=Pycnoporus cinnabarinus TaxID=5643 RepID=A0A060SIS5_PYCCI|nr:hypothetical protein BN946_scf185023.g2 [Trametes cinnabarina]